MSAVILTRFSRVTFNAAHRYLGLTTEVLRTEKAINDIACHPLPASFYEGGGLQYLRQRFDGTTTRDSNGENDYFNLPPPKEAGKAKPPILSKEKLAESPAPMRSSPFRTSASRFEVQAGDLHTTAAPQLSETYRPLTRSFSILNTPRLPRSTFSPLNQENKDAPARLSGDEFDLRDEVMSCIAKSIGLLQPPLSQADSVEASPAFPPTDGRRSPGGPFNSSFGSLSLLDLGDDSSSMTGGSSSINASGYMSGLDNDVEILFFAAGSTLAKAGERNTGSCIYLSLSMLNSALFSIGLFYVIEGFLDILLPIEEARTSTPLNAKTPGVPDLDSRSVPGTIPDGSQSHKLLFTVKPGGIAGYLGKPASLMYMTHC